MLTYNAHVTINDLVLSTSVLPELSEFAQSPDRRRVNDNGLESTVNSTLRIAYLSRIPQIPPMIIVCRLLLAVSRFL